MDRIQQGMTEKGQFLRPSEINRRSLLDKCGQLLIFIPIYSSVSFGFILLKKCCSNIWLCVICVARVTSVYSFSTILLLFFSQCIKKQTHKHTHKCTHKQTDTKTHTHTNKHPHTRTWKNKRHKKTSYNLLINLYRPLLT